MSAAHHFIRSDDSVVEVCTTDVSDGDFHVNSERSALLKRRKDVMPGEWAVVRQVHGARLVDADPAAEPEADALITAEEGQPIAVQGADCAPIAFITDTGPIAVAHAGWRGLASGIVGEVVHQLESHGARTDRVVVGALIGPECYEFGSADLDEVAEALGDSVRSETADGSPALDLRAAITGACEREGIVDVQFIGGCTACGGAGFSHRARGELQRHALAARILPGHAWS